MYQRLLRRVTTSVLVGSLALSQACHVVHSTGVSELRAPVRVHIDSPGEFVVRREASNGASGSAECAAYRIEGDLERVAGDTLVLQRVLIIKRGAGRSTCRWEGASYVVVSQSPMLHVQTVRLSGRTTATGLLVTAIVLLLLIAPFALSDGSYISGAH